MPDPTVPLPSTSVPLVGLAAEVVEGPDLGKRVAASELVQGGASSTFSVADLRAGSYRFICDQPGHEQAGMKGTLTVT